MARLAAQYQTQELRSIVLQHLMMLQRNDSMLVNKTLHFIIDFRNPALTLYAFEKHMERAIYVYKDRTLTLEDAPILAELLIKYSLPDNFEDGFKGEAGAVAEGAARLIATLFIRAVNPQDEAGVYEYELYTRTKSMETMQNAITTLKQSLEKSTSPEMKRSILNTLASIEAIRQTTLAIEAKQ
jgi:hypothetical protein